MNIFNNLYYEIMHESLDKKGLTRIKPKILRLEIIEAYKEYAITTNDKNINYREGEENLVIQLLKTLYDLSVKYEREFADFDRNPRYVKSTLATDNRTWATYVYDIQLRQPSKIVAIRHLSDMGLTIDIKKNERGFFVYPFHLINRQLQMNEAGQLFKKNIITVKTFNQLANLIVDDQAKKFIANEINEFNQKNKIPYKIDIDTEFAKIKAEKEQEARKPIQMSHEERMKKIEQFFAKNK